MINLPTQWKPDKMVSPNIGPQPRRFEGIFLGPEEYLGTCWISYMHVGSEFDSESSGPKVHI